MKNQLKKFEESETKFFVMKSYITAKFETDQKKAEYDIFFIKENSMPDSYFLGYRNLKRRKMNRKEIAYFLDVKGEKYKEVIDNEDGTIYNLKSRPFDKKDCPKFKQYALNLYNGQLPHFD
jgi:hypothetical protein